MLRIDAGSDLATILAGYRTFAAERAGTTATVVTPHGRIAAPEQIAKLCDTGIIARLDAKWPGSDGRGQGTRFREWYQIAPTDGADA